MTSDAELLRRFSRSDDREALGVLYARHASVAYRMALAVLRDPGEAEDAVQEAFLRLARQARAYDPRRPFLPWLKTLVVRTALNLAKAERRRTLRETAYGPPSDQEEEPMARMIDRETRARLGEEIEALPEELRLPLLLHYQEGFSYLEVSQALDCPQGTVGPRLSEARQRLRRQLATAGILLATGVTLEEAVAGAADPVAVPPGLEGTLASLARSPQVASAWKSLFRRPAVLAAASLLIVIGAWVTTARQTRTSPQPPAVPRAPARMPPPAASWGRTPPGPGTTACPETAAPAPVPPSPTEIHGRVTCQETGAPIEGATVRFLITDDRRDTTRSCRYREATTGEGGSFRFDLEGVRELLPRDVERFHYDLLVEADGFETSLPAREEIAWGEGREETLALSRGFGLDIRMSGPGGEPILHALLRFHVPGPSNPLAPFRREAGTILGAPKMGVEEGIGFALKDYASVPSLLAHTDGRYEYVVPGFRATTPLEGATVRLASPGFLVWERPLASLPVHGDRIQVDARLEPGRRLSGVLLDPDGVPCPNGVVFCWPADCQAPGEPRWCHGPYQEGIDEQTGGQRVGVDADGRFRITGLPPGKGVRLVAKGYGSKTPGILGRPVEIPAGAGEAEVTIRLERGTTLTGRVLDPLGNPVAGVEVTARGRVPIPVLGDVGREGVTDARGMFRIEGLPSGKISAMARHHDPAHVRNSGQYGWSDIPPDVWQITITLPDCKPDGHEQAVTISPG